MNSKSHARASLLTIGSELLKGSTVNTNARFLGERLLSAGFQVSWQVSCDDDIQEIQSWLTLLLRKSDLVIVSGGLGPTPDDVTREAISKFFKRKLAVCPSQKRRIQALYQKLGKIMPKEVLCEAQYPEKSVPLINRYGIALGFWIEEQHKHVIVLPGVPRELEKLIDYSVLPRLRKLYYRQQSKTPVIVKTAGLSEPAVMERLGSDFFDEPFEFGIYPHPGEVTLRIFTDSRITAAKIKSKALSRLQGYVYSLKDESLAEATGRLLLLQGARVSVAESCTGGLLAAELTKQAGASRFFHGGVVAYANSAKTSLGVSPKILKKRGAVSTETAKELASRARLFFKSEWAIGVTGVAGPGGGTIQKPVGSVFISVQGPSHDQTELFTFWGSRSQIQQRAVIKALELLWKALLVPNSTKQPSKFRLNRTTSNAVK